jgi:nucleoside-diphosphate-sugar epimerase
MSGPEIVTWSRFFEEFANALEVPGPAYWPPERIAGQSRGMWRKVRHAFSDPRQIVKVMVGSKTGRQFAQAVLNVMPSKLRTRALNAYLRGARRINQVFVPEPRQLALYTSKATVDSAKAMALLGYRPHIDFASGMARTRPYLRWAFDDVKGAVAGARRRMTRSQHIDAEQAAAGAAE